MGRRGYASDLFCRLSLVQQVESKVSKYNCLFWDVNWVRFQFCHCVCCFCLIVQQCYWWNLIWFILFYLNLTVSFKPCLRFTNNTRYVCISGRMQSYSPRLRKWKLNTNRIKLDLKSNGEFYIRTTFCVFLLMLFVWCTVKCVRNVHTMLSIIFF